MVGGFPSYLSNLPELLPISGLATGAPIRKRLTLDIGAVHKGVPGLSANSTKAATRHRTCLVTTTNVSQPDENGKPAIPPGLARLMSVIEKVSAPYAEILRRAPVWQIAESLRASADEQPEPGPAAPAVVALEHPIEFRGRRIAAIDCRRGRLDGLNLGDPVTFDGLIRVASRLSGLPEAAIDQLEGEDAGKELAVARAAVRNQMRRLRAASRARRFLRRHIRAGRSRAPRRRARSASVRRATADSGGDGDGEPPRPCRRRYSPSSRTRARASAALVARRRAEPPRPRIRPRARGPPPSRVARTAPETTEGHGL